MELSFLTNNPTPWQAICCTRQAPNARSNTRWSHPNIEVASVAVKEISFHRTACFFFEKTLAFCFFLHIFRTKSEELASEAPVLM
jgi:hypothetical protein